MQACCLHAARHLAKHRAPAGSLQRCSFAPAPFQLLGEGDDEEAPTTKSLCSEIRLLRTRRLLRTLDLVQDLAGKQGVGGGKGRQGMQGTATGCLACGLRSSMPMVRCAAAAGSPGCVLCPAPATHRSLYHVKALPLFALCPPAPPPLIVLRRPPADLLQVLAELRGSKGLLGHAATLALAGLVSGSLSAYKNWQKVARR